MRSASVAGPAGRVVRSPKNSTSTPPPANSVANNARPVVSDTDFIAGMIPHHKGAVEMAKIGLEHGDDPEVRKLAEGIIAAQEAEIAWMTDWLARNAAKAP